MNNNKKINTEILKRAIPAFLIIIISLICFNSGVYVASNPNLPNENILIQLYYSIGIFFLSGLDMGMPSGGLVSLRYLLLSTYFIAPLITAIAILETVLHAIRKPHFLKKKLVNHHVIVGAGTISKQYVQQILNQDASSRIVIVEINDMHKNLSEFRTKVERIIIGDISKDSVIKELNLSLAKQILLLTNNDIVNLNIMFMIDNVSRKNVLIRIEDEELKSIAKKHNVQTLSLHSANAKSFVDSYSEVLDSKKIVIYGFGRFGQEVLEEIQINGSIDEVIIIDPYIKKRWASFLLRQKISNKEWIPVYKIHLITSNQEDYSNFEEIKKVTPFNKDLSIVFCANLPKFQNIKSAILLAENFKEINLYIRTYGSNFEDAMQKEYPNIHLIIPFEGKI